MIAPIAVPFPCPAATSQRDSRSAGSPRFTIDGGDELENRLARTCATVMAGVRGLIPAHRLEAVLLGGGYGRGEGGVLPTDDGDRPYNDLEFYVCLRGNRHRNERRHRLPLATLGEILTPQVGVEIEFKIISLAELRRRPVSMFSHDLLAGHRQLWGDPDLLFAFTAHRSAENIPSSEATRLLMNRCSGLLFAQERLGRAEFTADDADFVQRNLAKAELAFGDAVLTTFGRYHWSAPARHRRLQRLVPTEPITWLDEIRRAHASGLEFKLHPWRSTASRTDLFEKHTAVVALALCVWLWQESRRLGTPFASAREYATSPRHKCPETGRLRNLLVNLKNGWLRGGPVFNPFRHPRERVLGALSLLLWGSPNRPPPSDFADLVAAYRELWQRVN